VLARIEGLKVAARTSSFHFKGQSGNMGDIARQLGVAHLLEGSVRRSGDRVRVTAQLINPADGFHLWSETYDRQLTDIFAIQDDIAAEVARALRVRLWATRRRRCRGRRPATWKPTPRTCVASRRCASTATRPSSAPMRRFARPWRWIPVSRPRTRPWPRPGGGVHSGAWCRGRRRRKKCGAVSPGRWSWTQSNRSPGRSTGSSSWPMMRPSRRSRRDWTPPNAPCAGHSSSSPASHRPAKPWPLFCASAARTRKLARPARRAGA
jgi:hypothetical protein